MAEAEVKELDKREEKADDITRAGDDRVEEERGRDQQRTKKKHRDHSESSSSSKSSLSDRSRSRRKNKKDDDEKISKKKKSYSRSRSPYDRRRRSSDRRNKYRSRSRSNSRDRRRNDRRYRGRSDSRSPPRKNYKNDSRRRSRSRSYSPKRNTRKNNNRSPSLSPISRRQKLREERIKAQANQLPNKFWDGFQWVERTPAVTGSTMQAVVEAINSSTSSNAPPTVGTSLPTPAISLAQQKDRRIYLGNLPPDVTPEFLKDFMNSAMVACGAVPSGVNSAVLSVWLGPDKKYAFIELCTAESAIVALGLNGISCMGHNLRVARPKTYNGDSMAGYAM